MAMNGMETPRESVSREDARRGRGSIRRFRAWRLAVGLNVVLSVALATALVGMLNVLSARYHLRWTAGGGGSYALSQKSRSLVASLERDVEVLVCMKPAHALYEPVRRLMREYAYAAGRPPSRLSVRFIDPDRDLAQARGLKQEHGLSKPNVLVFRSEGRTRAVPVQELVEYGYELGTGGGVRRKVKAFRGEQVVTSAIGTVAEPAAPVVYFTTGHGEHGIDDYSNQSGYSDAAAALRRDHIDVRTLKLNREEGIPRDAWAVVVAGPTRPFSTAEVDLLAKYLEEKGRLLALLDPAAVTGLEPLLESWGVKLTRDVVVGLTLTGRDLVVSDYGAHPITRRLESLSTMLYMPRSVRPAGVDADGEEAPADRPRVTVLASNDRRGWAETDLEQNPPRFDPESDLRGPVPVAVAVERGALGIEVEIEPTRLVVIGDSYFVSNAALKTGVGGNRDFFLSAVNWLLERDRLLAVGPRTPGELRLDLGRRELLRAYVLLAGLMPLAIAVVGLVVWGGRRL